MTNLLFEGAGWSSSVVILGAYALLSGGWLQSSSALYQGMNFLGAVGFVIYTSRKKAWASAALNTVWSGIALWALVLRH